MNTEQFRKEVQQIGREIEQFAFGCQKTSDGIRFKIPKLKAERGKMLKRRKDSKALRVLFPFNRKRFKARFRSLQDRFTHTVPSETVGFLSSTNLLIRNDIRM